MSSAPAASVLSLLIATGCSDRESAAPAPSPAPLAWDVRVLLVEVTESGGWCPAGVGTAVALAMGPWRFEDGEQPHLQVVVGCEALGPCVTVHAAVDLTVTSPSEPEALFDGAAVRQAGCSPWPLSVAFRAVAAAGAIREALAMAHNQYRILRAPDTEVLRVIEQGWPRGALIQALVVAGDRRMRGAVPLLLRHLDSGDSGVVMRAVGALGRIGDPAALRPLGRVALAGVPEVPHAALQAIADIGGNEARRVLEMVAEQAQSPVVAREARELLEGLGRGDRARKEGRRGEGE